MKILNLILIAILFDFTAYSQDKSIAKVHYQFKHINDTTQPENYLKDEVVTYLGTSSSFYTSYSTARISEQLTSQMSNPAFDGNLVLSSPASTAITEKYLIDFEKSNVDIIRTVGIADYILTGSFPQQDWQIEEDTKVIDGYTCQKATTNFGGRNYEAWFCADIPMSYGPWKLHGLPGLILSAKDEKGEVVFEYAGFDKTEGENSLAIVLSPNATQSTEEEVLKLEKALDENRQGFIQAQQAGRGSMQISKGTVGAGTVFRTPGGMNSIDPSKIKSMTVKKDENYKPSKITNNPIELTK